jgi:hypothetical protein
MKSACADSPASPRRPTLCCRSREFIRLTAKLTTFYTRSYSRCAGRRPYPLAREGRSSRTDQSLRYVNRPGRSISPRPGLRSSSFVVAARRDAAANCLHRQAGSRGSPRRSQSWRTCRYPFGLAARMNALKMRPSSAAFSSAERAATFSVQQAVPSMSANP